MTERVLAIEVVIERPLGDAGLRQDGIQVAAAKAGMIYLLKGGIEQPFAGVAGIAAGG